MKSEFNAGTILYGIPSEGSCGNPCIFLHDGEKTADGYGKVIDVGRQIVVLGRAEALKI